MPRDPYARVYDALAERPGIRHILPRHEQGAAFAADGYARITRRHGVVSTTTGPGTFNTLAALAEAWSDSSPVVLLGGQFDAALLGLGKGVLHETLDQGRSFEAVTAFVGRPRSGPDIPAAVAEALRCALTGRNRPAYVELPTDLLDLPHPGDAPAVTLPGPVAVDPAQVVAAARLLAAARRPLPRPRPGRPPRRRRRRRSGAWRRRLDAPVLTPITGIGTVAADDPRWAGHLVPGQPSTITLLEEADAVLVVGLRLDDVETGRWTLPFRNVIQIDVDPAAIGRAYPGRGGHRRRRPPGARGAARRARVRRGAPRTTPGAPAGRRSPATRSTSASRRRPAVTRDAFLAARAALPRDASSPTTRPG